MRRKMMSLDHDRYSEQSEPLFPTHPLSLSSQGICFKAPDCLSGYHSHLKPAKSSLGLELRTQESLLLSVLVNNLTHLG